MQMGACSLNTGGWYKICCPTSQLSKPDVLGAIYRVRRVGAERLDDPRGLKVPWKKMQPSVLVRLLGDERVAVQRRATRELMGRGEASIPALREALVSAP